MGHGTIVENKFDGLGNAFGGRGRYVDAVAAIVFESGANVPVVDARTGPGATNLWYFMDKHASAR